MRYKVQESVRVSVATIFRTPRHMGCSRQVMRRVRSDTLRACFMAGISIYDPKMFVWPS